MAWEPRHGGTYYYRPVRINGRPRKIYLGKGALAQAQAERDEQARQQRQEQSLALRAEQARVATADAALRDFRRAADVLLQAVLILSGLHLNHGEWRRRRELKRKHSH